MTFFDRQLLLNLGLTLISSVILIICIKLTTTIHLPYFVGAALAAGLGFLEPRRGWFLALTQVVFLALGYLLSGPPDNPIDAGIENFGWVGAIVLTFIGSAVGGLVKRALDE